MRRQERRAARWAERRAQLKPLREKAAAAEREIARLTRDIAEFDTLCPRGVATRANRQRVGTLPPSGLLQCAPSPMRNTLARASQAYEDALAEA